MECNTGMAHIIEMITKDYYISLQKSLKNYKGNFDI